MRPSQTWFGATRHSKVKAHAQKSNEGLNVEMQYVPPRCGKLHVKVLRANGIGSRSAPGEPIDAFVKAKFMPSGEFHRTSVSVGIKNVGFWEDDLVFEYSNDNEQGEPQIIFELVDDRPVLHNVIGRSQLCVSPFLTMESGRIEPHTIPLQIVGNDASQRAELVLAFRFVADGVAHDAPEADAAGGTSASKSFATQSSAKINGEVKRLFYMLDSDQNGWVTTDEFTKALEEHPEIRVMLGGGQAHHETPDQTAIRIFNEIDTDGGGYIVWSEFMSFVEKAAQKRERAMKLTASSPTRKAKKATHSSHKGQHSMALAHSDARVQTLANELARSQADLDHLSTHLSARPQHAGTIVTFQDTGNSKGQTTAPMPPGSLDKSARSPTRRTAKARRPLSVINDPRVEQGMAPDRESLEHEVKVLRARVTDLEHERRQQRTQRLMAEARIKKEYDQKMADFLSAESMATTLFKSSQRRERLSSSLSVAAAQDMDQATREQLLDLQTINIELRRQLKTERQAAHEGATPEGSTKQGLDEEEAAGSFRSPVKSAPGVSQTAIMQAELKKQRHELDDVLTHCKWLQERLTEKREKVKTLKQTCSSTQGQLKLEQERNEQLKSKHDMTLQQLRNFERAEFIRNRSFMEKKKVHDAKERDIRIRLDAQREVATKQHDAAIKLQSTARGGMHRRASMRKEEQMEVSATRIQGIERGRQQRTRYHEVRVEKQRAAIAMQSRMRNKLANRRFIQWKYATKLLQRYVRGKRGRAAAEARQASIVKIQCIERGRKARICQQLERDAEDAEIHIEEAALCLTSVAKMFLWRKRVVKLRKEKEDTLFLAAVQEEAATVIQEQMRKRRQKKMTAAPAGVDANSAAAAAAAAAEEEQGSEIAIADQVGLQNALLRHYLQLMCLLLTMPRTLSIVSLVCVLCRAWHQPRWMNRRWHRLR